MALWLFPEYRSESQRKKTRKLVAMARADGNAMTALCAAAGQDGCTAFGLHAGAETVRLRAAAAIGLKCALRHGSALLKISMEIALQTKR